MARVPGAPLLPRHVVTMSALTAAVAASGLLSLAWSSVGIPLDQVVRILLGLDVANDAWRTIVMDLRAPRVLTALLVGSSLGVAGLQMQTMFRNPLASPYTLGVVAGASLGAAIVIVVLPVGVDGLYRQGAASATLLSQLGVVSGAAGGAVAVLAIMLAVAAAVDDMTIVLLFGVVLGALVGALVTVLVSIADPAQTRAFVEWGFGSFGRVRWPTLPYFAGSVLLGLALAFATGKPLNAFLLGERHAGSVGLNVRSARAVILLSSAILAGAVVAYAGPIAFLGVAVPHVARGVLGTADHRVLLPGCVLIGTLAALLCGLLAELPGRNATLPINAATALFGAPVTFWVLLRRYRSWGFQ